jgi:hypothetical protein
MSYDKICVVVRQVNGLIGQQKPCEASEHEADDESEDDDELKISKAQLAQA